MNEDGSRKTQDLSLFVRDDKKGSFPMIKNLSAASFGCHSERTARNLSLRDEKIIDGLNWRDLNGG